MTREDEMMTDYCPNCGKFVGGESICPNCGAEIFNESGLNEEPDENSEEGQEGQ